MNTLFIVVLFIAEAINIFWMIFQASRIFTMVQIITWAIVSFIMWIIFLGYFIKQEEIENGKNKNQKCKK